MEYFVGQIIKAKVFRISKNVITFKTENGNICYLNISEVSDYFVKDLNMMFRVNDIKEVKIIEIMPNNELLLSFKQIHPKELRNPFEFRLDANDAEFESLLNFTNKEIEHGN
ncbi:S1 RNA-binding domain-containing protein [Metamycoplasma alkalescens]|uniref:30S ribosomal protein s1 n=1 Tax=Metamycoplasma alkalescens TaxID=45363 RepID=A0A318U5F1_9BACT|nr:S1 RNA-binding domain-containing protein [Metamycoplasma alkalescens]PYF43670.1 small subunit ribosomal protein S1 [Metamycoplasma alkalescens]SYV89594.1 30S ribosomal protein s1 [Metamycoplasma alkalescens]